MNHHPATFVAYLRVSTIKQGTTGVSLSEQRLAIENYAQRNSLRISRWFIETRSAASRGRPVFRDVIQLLKAGRADGVIMHKIDRGARNLLDWATLGELSDLGVDVRFVHDNLDLHSRGGRLAADIQAVIAADFIRNLRDEVRKGMRGRFRQGFYPMPAPIGYLDQGSARPKSIDPDRGSVIRRAFELYARGNQTLRSLQLDLYMRGLRTKRHRPLSVSALSSVLRNPFYTGELHLRATGEIFPGVHTPLVSQQLFDRVQLQLRRRQNHRGRARLSFTYRGCFRCSKCSRMITGEQKKGHIYYRCHNTSCHICIREDRIEAPQYVALLSRVSE